MLEKTIKGVIQTKIGSWINAVEDKKIKELIQNNLVITGGCFVSFLQNEEANDYDCYFRTKESLLEVAAYYCDLWNNKKGRRKRVSVREEDGRVKIYIKSDGVIGDEEELLQDASDKKLKEVSEKERKKYFPVFFTSNAITFSDNIQLIIRFYGEPSEIHDTFDFVHTKAYYTAWDRNLCIPKEVYEAVINKTLVYTGSRYPVCSLFRLRKFIDRGWTINAGQIFKIAYQTSHLDLEDIPTLIDQLVGVDILYFLQFIDMLEKYKKENGADSLSSSYVMHLIDEIF